MSGIEEDIVETPISVGIDINGYVITYWILYTGIFLLFLAIAAMGLRHGGDGVAGIIASGLLWVLLAAYPNRPQIET